MVSDFPKILIIGQYFDKRSGSGITMSNLFKGWDPGRIALIAREINHPDFTVCRKMYQLGQKENKRKFPFNLLPDRYHLRSGELVPGKVIPQEQPSVVQTKSGWKIRYERFLKTSNLIHYKQELMLSESLQQWIAEFNPDILYTQLSSLELIRFVALLKQKYQLPLAIHIMDDWPLAVGENGLFRRYWHKWIDSEFRNLISRSEKLLSISEAMSEEYERRYGLRFEPFHNPIATENWLPFSKKTYVSSEPFVILYAGRIGTGIRQCFLDIIQAIEILISEGKRIEFHIQAVNHDPILETLAAPEFVHVRKMVTYEQLPQVFPLADLLILPNDFDQQSVTFLRYSMPTKASEYMISGTPILVYSSSETAVTRHATKHGWGYIVDRQDILSLSKAIRLLSEDELLRNQLGNRAKSYASLHYDGNTIREEFRQYLCTKR